MLYDDRTLIDQHPQTVERATALRDGADEFVHEIRQCGHRAAPPSDFSEGSFSPSAWR